MQNKLGSINQISLLYDYTASVKALEDAIKAKGNTVDERNTFDY